MQLLADATSLLDRIDPVLALAFLGNGVQWWAYRSDTKDFRDAIAKGAEALSQLTSVVSRLTDKLPK